MGCARWISGSGRQLEQWSLQRKWVSIRVMALAENPLHHHLKRRLQRGFQAYRKCLQDYPVITKAITAGLLAGVGDVTIQCLLWKRKLSPTHSLCQWRSAVSVTIFGMVVSGPGMHFLHQLLETFSPRSSRVSVLKKVVVDRLIFTPPYLFLFFYTTALLEGRSLSVAWRKVRDVFWAALLWNWAVWGPAQYINLSYISLEYRVLFMNAVAFLWNLYTALVRRK